MRASPIFAMLVRPPADSFLGCGEHVHLALAPEDICHGQGGRNLPDQGWTAMGEQVSFNKSFGLSHVRPLLCE